MSDASNSGPSTPPPAYNAGGAPAFPPMPKNAGAAMGMASGFFGSTSPSTLVTFAVVVFVLGALLTFIGSFFNVVFLSAFLRFLSNLCDQLGLVLLLVGAARFIADACGCRCKP